MSGGVPGVKICGVCEPDDAAVAVALGATHVGVIRVPGSARERSLSVARAVCAAASGAKRVGVYVDASPETILAEAGELGLDAVQLHGRESPERVDRLAAHGFEVWKVVKPGRVEELLAAAERYGAADLILLEGASRRGHGGVGARFDWDEMEGAVRRLPAGIRVGVGGGLTAENVAEAVRRFRPALVDVSSGVEGESRGRKERRLIEAFIRAARGETRPSSGTGSVNGGS